MFMTTDTWIFDTVISCARSPSHGYSNTLNTICYVNTHHIRYHYFMLFHVHLSLLHRYWASRHYYCMFVNYWYTDMLLHRIPLHGYSVHSSFMFLHHYYIDSFVYMHWFSMYSCCMDHSLYLLLGYSSIPVTRLYSGTDIDIPVTGYVRCWYAICGIPYLLFSISCYPVVRYQQSSGSVIMLHVPCTVLVLCNAPIPRVPRRYCNVYMQVRNTLTYIR